MQDFLPTLHNILNNAYILFAFILGIWATVQAARNTPIALPEDADGDEEPGILGGQFMGAMVMLTVLGGMSLALALFMAVIGIPAQRWAYYLYAIFYVIVLPGTFSLLHGRDDRTAALIYAIVVIFAGTSAVRTPLLTGW